MFPSKSMFEYFSEMNRLFPKTIENDLQTTNLYSSAYSQSPLHSTFANRSSSSADSTSPESYPDVFTPFPRSTSELYNIRSSETPVQSFSDALPMRKQRPIVGRKILGNSEQSHSLQARGIERDVAMSNTWIDELSVTPPNNPYKQKSLEQLRSLQARRVERDMVMPSARIDELSVTPPNYPFEQNSQTRNYELFPTEKSFEFRTPAKPIVPSLSPVLHNLSPTFSNVSSGMSNMSPHSPKLMPSFTPRYTTPPRFSGFSSQSFSGASSSKDEIRSSKMCTFCRKNGERPDIYMGHSVKEKIGGEHVVTCPILKQYICSTCGATGEKAHTQ
ncbi:unnamed protein product [Parnassius apollo]|uniref:(apollo) hypothetical protein n=1 Tax=Parnassius apollo TaxID=110799 RepID=A0A8S3WJ62_PARAO|nr:unnamed protein product [Parnassius apollo]